MLDGFIPPADAEYLTGFELARDPYGLPRDDVFDDFFDRVGYVGAFRSLDSAWHHNWTEFLPR